MPVMSLPLRKVPRPLVARRALMEEPRLSLGSGNLWGDLRQVLLDPEPDPWELEVVRRWLRDEVERDLMHRLRQPSGARLVRRACRMAPHLIWKLPYSRGVPPERCHRRIVAVLLPLKLRLVEQQLAIYAFHEGLA